jgi:predicted DNA-binding protein YlxM (UPF0122 family)
MSLLADFYGELLSERQAEVFRYYYEDNLSLTEIAELLGVSKQAVSGMLKKTRDSLERFESELGLIVKHKQFVGVIAKIDERIKEAKQLGCGEQTALKELKEVKKLVAGLEI